jgi:hypothetical protein
LNLLGSRWDQSGSLGNPKHPIYGFAKDLLLKAFEDGTKE